MSPAGPVIAGAGIPDRTPIDDAVLAMLRAVTGRPVGDAEVPRTAADVVEATPYAILVPMDTALTGGLLIDAHGDGKWDYQLTSVGATRQQVTMLAQRGRAAFFNETATGAFANAIAVAGQKVMGREFISSSGVDPEGDTFQISDRFAIWTTPA